MSYELPEREFIRCEDCANRAIIKIKSGWKRKVGEEVKPEYINVCMEHYEQEHLNEAQKWNHDNGLDTEEKRKDYCFKTPFKFKQI